MLAAFMLENPRVEVHLEETNRRVDVVAEGIDIAIRVRPPPLQDSDLVLRVVLTDRGQCPVASPKLLESIGTPQVPADLALLPSLGLGVPQGEHVWTLFGPDGSQVAVHHQPRLITRGMWLCERRPLPVCAWPSYQP